MREIAREVAGHAGHVVTAIHICSSRYSLQENMMIRNISYLHFTHIVCFKPTFTYYHGYQPFNTLKIEVNTPQTLQFRVPSFAYVKSLQKSRDISGRRLASEKKVWKPIWNILVKCDAICNF